MESMKAVEEPENQLQESTEEENPSGERAADHTDGVSLVSPGVSRTETSRAETSTPPASRLKFQGTNRGYLSVMQDGHHLTIASAKNTVCKENYRPYDFKSFHFVWKDSSDVKLVALENLRYSDKAESLFLCGDTDSYTVCIENTSRNDTKTWWRPWAYPYLFPHCCCSAEAKCTDCSNDSRVVLQYWGNNYQYIDPKKGGSLFLVIEGGGTAKYQFCLRSKSCARLYGAFVWGSSSNS